MATHWLLVHTPRAVRQAASTHQKLKWRQTGSGAVHVYTRDVQGQWTRQAFIKAAVPIPGEHFGRNVALSDDGNRMLVAAGLRLLLFVREAGQWRQDRIFTGAGVDYDGGGMALSGDGRSIAVRAFGTEPGGNPLGYLAVHVLREFTTLGEGWQRVADLRSSKPRTGGFPPHEELDDAFGTSLSFSHSGSTLAVGAHLDSGDANDTGNSPNFGSPTAGAVYVFAPDGNGAWQRQAFLKAKTAPPEDQLGQQVAMSSDGSVVAAKACGLAANAVSLRRNHSDGATIGLEEGERACWIWGGSSYFFERGDGQWSHTAAAIAAPGELVPYQFFSLAISGDGQTVGLGAPVVRHGGDSVTQRVVVY